MIHFISVDNTQLITGVRLMGSLASNRGRVEVKVNGIWGTVCDDFFDSEDARVICEMLGFSGNGTWQSNAFYGEGSGPIHVDDLQCTSSDHDLNECYYIPQHNCGHNEDASVICQGSTITLIDARLMNGTSRFSGRAEVNVNGTWGTLCDRDFDIITADLFCAELYLRALSFVTGSTYGSGTGPIYQTFCELSDIQFEDCIAVTENCTQGEEIGIVCSACGQPNLYHWDIGFFQNVGEEFIADCSYYSSYLGELRMKCNNDTGEWYTEGKCEQYQFPLEITDMRLVSGNITGGGRVEIKSLGTWGTICDSNFTMNEANVLCRMLGSAPARSFYRHAYFGVGKGPIFVDNLRCPENASHINNCSYTTYDNCEHSNDISVVCTDCGDPTPEYGYTNSSATSVGNVQEIHCDTGYRLQGNSIVVCQLNGEWSGHSVCQLTDCGDPTPANGLRNSTEMDVGAAVMITCQLGYSLEGQNIIICLESGSWTSRPTCKITDCGQLLISHATVEYDKNKTTYGSQAVISCDTGYVAKGSTIVTCLATGMWESAATCDIVDCYDPTPAKGIRNSTETTYGTVVHITCEGDYNITDDEVIICQADGSWSGSPTCESGCSGVLLPNGRVDTSNGTRTGSIAFARCHPGYDLHGSATLLCTDKGWNATVSCKRQDCGYLTLLNGFVRVTAGTLFGDTARVECNIGHELVGDAVIICEAGGVWSEIPTCEVLECETLRPPLNGTLNDTEGTEYGATVGFECNNDFLLVGNQSIYCDSNGKWSADPPLCVAKSGVGGACQGNEYCLTRGALCRNNICTCQTGIHDARTRTCDAMPLLPYGSDESDLVIAKTSPCGPKLTFSPGIPIFTKKHTELHVCGNGIVSFDQSYSNPTPPGNKIRVTETFSKRTIIAPFHAEIDIPNSGPVYYRTYDILNSFTRMQEKRELIIYIEGIVNKFQSVSVFEAVFVLIATWTDTICARNDFSRSKTSTFQVVIVTDGRATYAFNIYGQGLMQWEAINAGNDITIRDTLQIIEVPPIFIGYVADTIDTFTHPLAFSSLSTKLDVRVNEEIVSERDVAGLIFKAMTRPSDRHENHAVDCIKWYNENKAERRTIDYVSSLMPECPCDIWLSRFDPWFWRIGLERWNWYKNYACVDMLPAGNFGRYGKSCCYNMHTWSFVNERPLAGGFQLYHPRKFPAENFNNDALPKTKCCVLSDHCDLFYKLRPIGNCYTRSPYNFGMFWGDPHFQTLDGLNFTFNGLGEFTMLQLRTENTTFDLQTRTERAVKQDGNLSDATIFSAFAAKDYSNASVHVELNKAKTGMNVFANNVDLTAEYNANDTEMPFEYTTPDNNIYLAKRDGALSVLFPLSGISLNISVSVRMLSLSTIVPQSLRNMTGKLSGLLGNYDGDPSNDYTMPNGTVLPQNISERRIFEYGMTWAIEPENSAFVYEDGKSHEDYRNASYVPKFLDEANPTKRAEADKICNGSQSIECIFDYVFTENPEVAASTNGLKIQTDVDKKELVVTTPILQGCNTIDASVGENVSCRIQYNSSDAVDVIYNNTNVQFDSKTSTIMYYQGTEDPVDIRIISRNDEGRSSSVFQLSIVLCTGCNEHGQCTTEIREDIRSLEYFRYYACDCEPQYEGINCENVFDGCASKPCSHGRLCTSLTAEEQIRFNRSYNCSGCPSGYTELNDSCTDIDECKSNLCDHVCINTDGSFSCFCRTGFRLDTANVSRCKDINECEEALHNCSQVCNNTVGGFSCGCHKGYTFNSTSRTCSLSKESSCNSTALVACSKADGCLIFDDGAPKCFCNEGYELDDTGTSCRDINECDRNICPQDCRNNNGSFSCVCYTGYKLVGKITCRECEIPNYGENCEHQCVCTGQGADRCDIVKGCICQPGWKGNTCDVDINECLDTTDICKDLRKVCVNTQGSYACRCKTGFTELEDGSCRDLDECAIAGLNRCTQTCSNTVGGYTCGCYTGYTQLNATHCKDINECSIGTHRCQQRCENNQGTYSCSCYFGYTLNDDRHTCEKQRDPCLSELNITCAHYCFIDGNSASCKCYDGHKLGSDLQTCIDINECNGTENQCDHNAVCTNVPGTYFCSCPTGFRLENDGRTCSECDIFHYGIDCLKACNCLNGQCNRTTGCVCDRGWSGEECDEDINECEMGLVICSEPNSVCVNTLGSAFCKCKEGYSNASGECKDINECAESQSNNCDQICVNSDGSYRCDCRNGFQKEDGRCLDINECLGSHGCAQICDNTAGGYRCSCFDGYRLNLTDRRTCLPENDCLDSEKAACGNHSSCLRSFVGHVCSCLKGFQNVSNSCHDIDECTVTPNLCSQICKNSIGSFTCSCNDGFFIREDKTSCKECDANHYGSRCTQNCTCDPQRSIDCNNVNGTCLCKQGWTGDNCTNDVNECLEYPDICKHKNSSVCKNTAGSYMCVCDNGYLDTEDSCKACKNWTYSHNCGSRCWCNITNTMNCDSVNGSCYCKLGWTATDCSVNINECEQHVVCPENSICVDSAGSYECVCHGGYRKINGSQCRDIDECLEELDNCSQLCNNTNGGYECTCRSGYSRNSNNITCDACDLWKYGNNCSSTCKCKRTTTIICNATDGHCVCLEGWQGETCDDDVNECIRTNICPENSTCQNMPGTYSCSCNVGFYEATGNACTECSSWTYGTNCSSDCLCNRTNTQHCNTSTGDCMCKQGWTGSTCDSDFNECQIQNKCPEHSTCIDSPGSFHCKCDLGYDKNDNGYCSICDKWQFGEACSNICSCNVTNTDACGHVTGECTCNEGWEGRNCTQDIDECSNTTRCEHIPNSTCINTIGSFECQCNAGFRKEGDTCTTCPKWKYGLHCESNCLCNQTNTATCDPKSGTCHCIMGMQGDGCNEDNDECKTTRICPDNSTCSNTIGSFICTCNTGFQKDNNTCKVCKTGFYGQNCQKQCTCNFNNTETCNHETGLCLCKQGWTGMNCTDDVDECQRETNPCQGKPHSTCKNTIGSFTCKCDIGYKESGDSCTVCDSQDFGENCEKVCQCFFVNTETCHRETGSCTCRTGWTGDNCTTDVNECFTSENLCQNKSHSSCLNINGSFLCVCSRGFQDIVNVCQACDSKHYGDNCSGKCLCTENNTVACNRTSGECSCKQGWHGDICSEDIIECVDKPDICRNKTSSSCVNTLGSYRCDCDTGFQEVNGACKACKNNTYGRNCENHCHCNAVNARDPYQTCDTVNGTCFCSKAWKGETCNDDVDECMDQPNICQGEANSACNNTLGSYRCDCISGYKDNIGLCQACNNNTYGKNCENRCTCNNTNARDPLQSCDTMNGTCLCSTAWKGNTCNDDVNECVNQPNICQDKSHSTCNNTVGSYHCDCDSGYVDRGNVCQACANNTYGSKCEKQCQCIRANANDPTQTCNTVSGTCLCRSGWTGDKCNDDVDECLNNTCQTSKKEVCVNTIGSYRCDCQRGYNKRDDGECFEVLTMTTTTQPNTATVADLAVKIEYDLPPGTNLNSDSVYADIESKARNALLDYYRRFTTSQIDIKIVNISSGSINVKYSLLYMKTDTSVRSLLAVALGVLAKGANVVFDGKNATAVSGAYQGLGLCDLYETNFGVCGEKGQCVIVNNAPTCSEDNNENWAAIIGGTAGAILVITAIAMAVYMMWRRQQIERSENKRASNLAESLRRREEKNKETVSWSDPPSWSGIIPRAHLPDYTNRQYNSQRREQDLRGSVFW